MKTIGYKDCREFLSEQEVIELYRDMARIRLFEDKVQEVFAKGLVFGTTHLCQGQEAVSVGAMKALGPGDYITYTYRGHGQCLARGMNPADMFAELFGRSTGVCQGKGGSMHMMDKNLGLINGAAIVGAGLPVAVGAAMSCKMKSNGNIAATFFGEGSTNIGAFHESLNLASIWKLPVIFICENNLYGEYTRINLTTPVEDIADRADSYNMRKEIVDGNNVFSVIQAVREARAYALDHPGPTLIECKTYRQCGHSRTDPAKYRLDGELEHWLDLDPLLLLQNEIIENGIETADSVKRIFEEVQTQIDQAAAQAEQAPWPDLDDAKRSIYSDN